VGGQALLPGVQPGRWGVFYNKDMFDAAGIPYPDPWPPMSGRGVRRHRVPTHGRGRGRLAGGGPLVRPAVRDVRESRRPDGPGLPKRAGGRPPVRGPLRHRPRRVLPDREHDRAVGRGPRLLPAGRPRDGRGGLRQRGSVRECGDQLRRDRTPDASRRGAVLRRLRRQHGGVRLVGPTGGGEGVRRVPRHRGAADRLRDRGLDPDRQHARRGGRLGERDPGPGGHPRGALQREAPDLHPEQVGHVRAVLRRVGLHARR